MVSILIDDDILLRTLEPEDAPLLFKAINASRIHLRPWLNWVDRTQRPEHSLQFIQQSQQQMHQQEALALGIFHGQQIIGGMGMHGWDHNLKKAQIGYWICKDWEGKGIISRCAERFLDFLFEKLSLNKVELHFMVQNSRSAAVAQRLGARIEGVIRQSLWNNGMLTDVVITGILKEEWEAHRSARS